MNTHLYLPHMSGCAHLDERRLARGKIDSKQSKVFELVVLVLLQVRLVLCVFLDGARWGEELLTREAPWTAERVRRNGHQEALAVAQWPRPPTPPVLRLRHRPSNSAALTLFHAPPPRLRLARRPAELCVGVRLSRAAAAVQRAILEWVATTARMRLNEALLKDLEPLHTGPPTRDPTPVPMIIPPYWCALLRPRAQRAGTRAQSAQR